MKPPGDQDPPDLDLSDPFGTRPDEKPPAGWQDRFWDGVRARIVVEAAGDDNQKAIPDPPVRPHTAPLLAAALILIAAAAGILRTLHGDIASPFADPGPGVTRVRVSGASHPVVDVEWATLNGERSNYVILRSDASQVAYVLLERPPLDVSLARRDAPAERIP